MNEIDRGEVTRLLARWHAGDHEAGDELLPLIYAELRAVANRLMRSERAGHTLQPTALVHEAWLRLVDQRSPFANREQFFALAARSMRRILVDHARARQAARRPSSAERVEMETVDLTATHSRPVDVLDLDRELERLAELDERQARIVELRCFAGLTVPEAAAVLGTSESTIARDWRMARAWLRRRLAS